ncbi:MAG: hypothetical protein OSB69_17100 [Alphaproteobacteria bacterium]|jgi:hypothetical protein|nr:hypothetical protein [Alphaproteobacteria bacterium]
MGDHAKDRVSGDGKIFLASMDIAASLGWERCSLSDIATKAEIDIADLTELHGDKIGILRALAKFIDSKTLTGLDSEDGSDISVRENLLESLMLRFDTMAPYKSGIANVARATLANPRNVIEGSWVLARSMRETLSMAGLSTSGPLGMIRVKAMMIIFLDVFRVWIDDQSPDLSATLRRLDERLNQAESLALTFGIAQPSRSVY